MKNDKRRFEQGYLCAVCSMLNKDGGASTQVRELFKECGGGYDIKLWRKWGIDEYDIATLKKYRKELI